MPTTPRDELRARRMQNALWLKEERERVGISQEDLAQLLPSGTTRTDVARWENGDKSIPLELVTAICEALGRGYSRSAQSRLISTTHVA